MNIAQPLGQTLKLDAASLTYWKPQNHRRNSYRRPSDVACAWLLPSGWQDTPDTQYLKEMAFINYDRVYKLNENFS